MDKKERFCAAYEHLLSLGRVHKQKDVATAMGSTEGNISQAIKGNPKVLTDRFLMRFIQAFPDIFSMQWLFTGSGTMLINGSAPAPAPVSNAPAYTIPDLPPVMAAEPTPLTDRATSFSGLSDCASLRVFPFGCCLGHYCHLLWCILQNK